MDVEVDDADEPFWLVLGQSASDGWTASVDGGTAGPRTVVDGYANGWLITPDGSGPIEVHLRWGPQRLVWVGFAVSGLAIAACVGLLVRGRRRARPLPDLAATPSLGLAASATPSVATAVASAVLVAAAALVATVQVALVAGVLTGVAGVVPRGRLVLVVAAPASLALARPADRPTLAWLAVALLLADLLLGRDDISRPALSSTVQIRHLDLATPLPGLAHGDRGVAARRGRSTSAVPSTTRNSTSSRPMGRSSASSSSAP